jgi:Flp pilus assembly protein TadG
VNVFTEILVPCLSPARHSAASATARPHAATRVRARLAHLLLSEEEGASLVEFAIVSSMLLLPLTTFILSFGTFMTNQMQLINAVDIGARAVAVNGGITLNPCSVASSAVIGAAPGLNPSQLTFSYSFNGVPYSGTSCPSATLLTGAAANLAGGTTATVTATYPCSLMIFGRNFMPNGCAMKASTSEMVQ